MSWKSQPKWSGAGQHGNWSRSQVGPWEFAEQPDKWGYLNDPRWAAQHFHPEVNYTGNESEEPQIWTPRQGIGHRGAEHVHHPCGHWHKQGGVAPPGEIYAANLYGLTERGNPSIWGVNFDLATETLTWGGLNTEANVGVDYNGLVICPLPADAGGGVNGPDKLCTIWGLQADAKLRFIDLDPTGGYLLTNYDHAIPDYETYDINNNTDLSLVWNPEDSRLWAYGTGDDPANGKFDCILNMKGPDNNYERIGRIFPGTLLEGTDGNFYQFTYYYQNWTSPSLWYPVTGSSWDTKWQYIPDQIIDGQPYSTGYSGPPTVPWYGHCSSWQCYYKDGYIYMVIAHGPSSRTRKYGANGSKIQNAYVVGLGNNVYQLRPFDDKLLLMGGNTSAYVGIVSTGDLATDLYTWTSGYGRGAFGDCVVVEDTWLVVCLNDYGLDAGSVILFDKELNEIDNIDLAVGSPTKPASQNGISYRRRTSQ